MIQAGAGLWVNYATTLAFQIAIASRLGTTDRATTFAVSFSILIAIGGVVTATAQTVVVPRLLNAQGELEVEALRLLIGCVAVAGLALATLALFASPSAHLLAAGSSSSLSSELAAALRFGAVFAFSQVIAGMLIAIGIARGARFAPAVGPALPSIGGLAVLGAFSEPRVSMIYVGLGIGAVIEVGVLAAVCLRGVRRANGVLAHAKALSVATAAQLAVLALIAPTERIASGWGSASGPADYNYAIRSLAVAQQLLVGGLLLAALGDWSRLANGAERGRLLRGIRDRVSLAGAALSVAACVALVFSRPLVALVYQHGSFDAADAARVARILRFALLGFVAEGVGLVISQAFVAARMNVLAIKIGLGNFVLRMGLIAGCGLAWGASGVAIAYSIASLLVLAIQMLAARRHGLLVLRIRVDDMTSLAPAATGPA